MKLVCCCTIGDYATRIAFLLLLFIAANTNGESLRLGIISDTHISDRPEDSIFLNRLEQAIAQVNAAKVDAVLVPGDLTSHGLVAAVPKLRKTLDKLEAPYYLVPGNHDVGSKPMPEKESSLTQQRVDAYVDSIGPTFYATGLSNHVKLIALNSALFGMGLTDDEAQWRFLEAELQAGVDQQVVLLMHYPPFVEKDDEPSSYFNLDPEPRRRLLDLIDRFEVEVVVSGHLHRPLDQSRGATRYISAPAISFGLPHDCQPEAWTLLTLSTDRCDSQQIALDAPDLPEDVRQRVAAFYYPWYATENQDGRYLHWTQANHAPPSDLASNFWPVLGAYSSTDPRVLDQHMQWARQAGIGVLITSWWGTDSFEDQATPALFDAAHRHGIKIAFHLEPYAGSTPRSFTKDVLMLLQRYGDHPSMYYPSELGGRPPIFVFESLRHSTKTWVDAISELDKQISGDRRPAWFAQTTDLTVVTDGGFYGGYAYDIIPWFNDPIAWSDYNSSLDTQFRQAGKTYIPSIGPGYLDDYAVPRGADEPADARDRERGLATYRAAWRSVAATQSPLVTITSFNEWHEGSQIEPAVAHHSGKLFYAGYPSGPDSYLRFTRRGVELYGAAIKNSDRPNIASNPDTTR